MKTNFIKMSVAVAMLLGSSVYAGKIIGVDANASYVETTPPTQHGFGGWNLDNVNVRMVDAETGEDNGLIFNESNGTYDIMTYGDSFRSDILASDGTTVMGILKGKDWPVGEPAGVKVVNDDFNTSKSGKSPNCIMTTSYLDANDSGTGETGYLDIYDINPNGIAVPTVCSSPFQSHKRFKVNMQPSTVDGVTPGVTAIYGQHIDLVFNLEQTDTNATARRYQVFSKINNYTGMRLDGYKVELLDENGTEVNASHAIKFSLDLTTKMTSDDESGYEAVFSNGLWGPKDAEVRDVPHFTEDGFFDNKRAGFVQAQQDDSNQTLVGGPTRLGSNYVDLFGIWLPSKWAPYGIFFDDDNDTTTDAELVAFWGTEPNAPAGTLPAWHSGQDYNTTDADGDQSWAEPTEALAELANNNPLYSIGVIEDTLNLGLNYVVEVGLNSTIGKTFTIRITPRVAPEANQTAPSYIDGNGNYILPPQLIPAPAPAPTTVVSGGGGGGCTYNPDSKNFDMMFLVMMAMGLLYPFRRRFIK